jgi:aerobic-type carbon monoxide dehydrogenase small subunit (CoxS/CutS family)
VRGSWRGAVKRNRYLMTSAGLGCLIRFARCRTWGGREAHSDIEQSLGGNICRCGTYVRIRTAVKHAADRLA